MHRALNNVVDVDVFDDYDMATSTWTATTTSTTSFPTSTLSSTTMVTTFTLASKLSQSDSAARISADESYEEAAKMPHLKGENECAILATYIRYAAYHMLHI